MIPASFQYHRPTSVSEAADLLARNEASAKILAGGLPGGAVTGKAEIIDMIQLREDQDFNRSQRIAHNGTFNATLYRL